MELSVRALGIGPGDEVILPTFTIISCAAAIVRAGARPVVVDADPVTWNMDVGQIEGKITAATKAIMVVHIYGLPVEMAPVLALAEKYGLAVIEDAAEAIGQTYNGKPCGSFGDISVFSFFPNKHVTTGEGGMVLMDENELADRCRKYRNLCFEPGNKFIHRELGYNFRLSNLQAAVGCAQLERLDETLEKKRHIGRLYQELLVDTCGCRFPPQDMEYADNLYWVFGLVLDDDIAMDVQTAMSKLKQKGIGTRNFFTPMHEQPVFQRDHLFDGQCYPVSERIARRGFYLPTGLALSDDDIRFVVKEVRALLT